MTMARLEPELAPANAPLLLQALRHLEASGNATAGAALVWLLLLLLRYLVGLHSYSGAGTPPMFGDYEAQRHWMELTVNLPVSDWYFNTTENDLLYWGLDYPPLTAYVSYLFGRVAQHVEPEMVQLEASRGYETATSKVFMRSSVLLCDVLLFAPAVFFMARALYPQQQQWTRRTAFLVLVLAQPSLLLIDHGHFQVQCTGLTLLAVMALANEALCVQYNNVCLGFSALGAALILGGHEFLGSVSFSLALNFKQMALYYAPAFGVYLLARCIHRRNALLHLLKLGVAVVAVFAVMWLPFCVFPFAEESCVTSTAQGKRGDHSCYCRFDILYLCSYHVGFGQFCGGSFRLDAGCSKTRWPTSGASSTSSPRSGATSTRPRRCDFGPCFSWSRWSRCLSCLTAWLFALRYCSTLLTFAGFAPSVIDLLRRKPTGLRFILSMAISSLSFFLFSFQGTSFSGVALFVPSRNSLTEYC